MILTGQSFSSFDERTLGDSTARSPNFAIELNHTSFGALSAGDLKDYYAITPGAGDFALFVTTDPANGFTTQAFNFDFDVKITDGSGAVLLNSDFSDPTTRGVAFSSAGAGVTYYVEITNLSSGCCRLAGELVVVAG